MDDNRSQKVSLVVLGLSVSSFFVITYFLCIALGLLWPDEGIHKPWLQFFPGFEWLTIQGFVTGFVEAVLYGWYVAAVFGTLYNFFSRP